MHRHYLVNGTLCCFRVGHEPQYPSARTLLSYNAIHGCDVWISTILYSLSSSVLLVRLDEIYISSKNCACTLTLKPLQNSVGSSVLYLLLQESPTYLSTYLAFPSTRTLACLISSAPPRLNLVIFFFLLHSLDSQDTSIPIAPNSHFRTPSQTIRYSINQITPNYPYYTVTSLHRRQFNGPIYCA